jgi:hypothetical protein
MHGCSELERVIRTAHSNVARPCPVGLQCVHNVMGLAGVAGVAAVSRRIDGREAISVGTVCERGDYWGKLSAMRFHCYPL